ncbi:hypothetical protein Poly30_14890 [Planctomycetes bacterium Poly30]|uniref:FG-GAP repeat protein n=1 Tax=Saltatorellus ferox TaxID=2528018 RepID=A0A518EPH6_9BACT|nr:hypothetical protein Poly30_14890 [Planctomycetes bacterium Poly30]
MKETIPSPGRGFPRTHVSSPKRTSLWTARLRGTGVVLSMAAILTATASAQSRVTMPDAMPLDWFGYDVAADGPLTVVGSWRDDDAGPDTGSAHLVVSDSSASGTYLQKLVLADATAGDRAGENVAIGSGYAVVSFPGREIARSDGSVVHGAVAVFAESGGRWVEVARLDDASRSDGDLFGMSVAVEGEFILVGAPRDDEFAPDGGAVYVFRGSGGNWVRTQKIRPTDIGQHDYFGHDLAMAGDHGVVSAYNDDDQGVNAGAAYVLDLVGNNWSVGQKLMSREGGNFDLFGTSVAMVEDTIIVGAPQNEDADPEAVSDEGAVFVFEWSRTIGEWYETMALRPGDPNPQHRFGIDVAIGNDLIVVGAANSDVGVLNSGSAHIFRQRSRDWFEVSRHVSAASQAYDYLGLSVAVGDHVVVGVPGANDARAGGGAIDLIAIPDKGMGWGQTFCHSNVPVGGFQRMGGEPNSRAACARLTTAGSQSVSRDDLVLRTVGMPPATAGILYLGQKRANYSVGDGTFCVSAGRSGYQFAKKYSSEDGRLIQRHPIGRIEAVLPGATSFMVGQKFIAQVAYYDAANSAWNTTNALEIEFTN